MIADALSELPGGGAFSIFFSIFLIAVVLTIAVYWLIFPVILLRQMKHVLRTCDFIG